MELEAIEEGVLGKIIQPEGSEGIPVNEPIAVILAEGEDASAAEGVMAGYSRLPTPIQLQRQSVSRTCTGISSAFN